MTTTPTERPVMSPAPAPAAPAKPVAPAATPSAPVTPPAAPAATPEAPVTLCEFPVPQGTEKNGQKVSKPCVKPKGHDGEHSSRVYAKVDTKRITADLLTSVEDVPTYVVLDTVTEQTRSPEQIMVDGHVKEAHEKWLAGGKVSGFNEAIKTGAAKRYFCAPEDVAGLKAMLRRAASLHGIHVRIAPPKNHVDGRTMLYWIAVNKREKKAETPAATPAAATPAAPAGDVRK